jgi:hypothetical protein
LLSGSASYAEDQISLKLVVKNYIFCIPAAAAGLNIVVLSKLLLLVGCQSTPGNIGNIPLVIIGAICRANEDNPFGMDPEACNSQGVAYISFGQWVCIILFLYRVEFWTPAADRTGIGYL